MKTETIMLIISAIINVVSVPTSLISSVSAWRLSRSQIHNTDVDTQTKMLANVREAVEQLELQIKKGESLSEKLKVQTQKTEELNKRLEDARKYQVRYERTKHIHFNLLSDRDTAMWSVNSEGKVETANHNYRDMFGIDVEDVQKLNWVDFIHEEDRYRVRRFWEGFKASSRVGDEVSFRIVNPKTKKIIPVNCKLATLHDVDGTTWEIIARSRKVESDDDTK